MTEVEERLASGDPARVADALDALAACVDGLEDVTIPAPAPAVLAAFGPKLPREVEETYLRLITQGTRFRPPLTPAEQVCALLEVAAAREAPSYPLEASLICKAAPDPRGLLVAVFALLAAWPDDASHRAARGAFVEFLDAGSPAFHEAASWKIGRGLG
jgi:hypothetical protein